MIKLRLAIFAAFVIYGIWHNINSDIEAACAGNQACLAASL